ncbi:MAG TPA: hypothetical protein VIJ43_07050 [Burkholderiales bacterium]
MKITKLTLLLLVGMGTGCTTVPPASLVSMSDLPNCFDSNYDKERGLFTLKNDVGNPVNQQCLLTVSPRGDTASASRLAAGSYRVYLANGGGGGGGGSLAGSTGGGGGGGGAGAMETQATVNLTEGVYKLTIGAGGPGGTACVPGAGFGGGPGWIGSPSNMIRIATGEVVVGTPGADRHVRPTRSELERMAGKMEGHGGSGPGQTTGGHGGVPGGRYAAEAQGQPGASTLASGRSGVAGAPGEDDQRSGSAGGGGGATSMGSGGGGGGESPGRKEIAPERGSLGSGGGGGEGNTSECDPGARGGHGYIALRPM